MSKITTIATRHTSQEGVAVIGIDLAKNVFAVHGVNTVGKPVLVQPAVRRDQLLDLLAQLPPCLVGMEACTGAQQWARQLAKKAPRLSIASAA